jgi:hypothetical protein
MTHAVKYDICFVNYRIILWNWNDYFDSIFAFCLLLPIHFEKQIKLVFIETNIIRTR